MNAYVAVVRRLPCGRGLKTSRNFANLTRTGQYSSLPPSVSYSNILSYFRVWSRRQTNFLNYGSDHRCSAPALLHARSRAFLSTSATDAPVGLYGGDSTSSGAGGVEEPNKEVRRKVSILDLKKKHKKGEPITMMTAYDYSSAQLSDGAGLDILLVGDSVGMVVMGQPSTVAVTMEDMLHHCRAVQRGAPSSFLVGDMPFGSYLTVEAALGNACALLKQGGMDAVKLEGGRRVLPQVEALVGAGISVVGHIGLTPQSASALGGYRVQGATAEAAVELCRDALALQAAGACALVLEMVPSPVAEFITQRLDIPTIGIGAGGGCSGQVLVYHDILGLFSDFSPKFCKQYANLGPVVTQALDAYRRDVATGQFPTAAHSFALPRRRAPTVMAALDAEFSHLTPVHRRPPLPPPSEQKQQQATPAVDSAAGSAAADSAAAKIPQPEQQQNQQAAAAALPLPPPSPIRRVAVIGGGALGSLVSARLSAAGAEVWMVSGWEEQVSAVNSGGLTVSTSAPDAAADAAAAAAAAVGGSSVSLVSGVVATASAEDVAAAGGADLVVVAVKGDSTQAAVAAAAVALRQPSSTGAGGGGVAMTLQNGMGNVELLAAAVGADRCVAGVTSQGAVMLSAGHVLHAGHGTTHIAPYAAAEAATAAAAEATEATVPLSVVQAPAVAELLDRAGLRASAHPADHLPSLQWGKLAVNAVVNPVTALLRLRNGELLQPQHAPLLASVAGEVEAVAAAAGVELPFPCAAEAVRGVLAATAGNTSSMLSDVLRSGVACEADSITGHITRTGRRLGVPTPVNDTLLSLLQAGNLAATPPRASAPVDSAAAPAGAAVASSSATATAAKAKRSSAAHSPCVGRAHSSRVTAAFSTASGSSGGGGGGSDGSSMGVADSVEGFRALRASLTGSVGFVPTMGALHDGHLSLVRAAAAECDHVVASVFVNPAQFAAHEDLGTYPRTLQRDLELLRAEGVAAVFVPGSEEVMYPSSPPFIMYVDPAGVDGKGEGSARPGFFRGVSTVCTKLLNIATPSHAFFGQKDGLQCIMLRTLVRDLNFPVTIRTVPTRREADGLAMSSRNVYLSPEQRDAAPVVFRALQAVQAAYEAGERQPEALRAVAASVVATQPLCTMQYLSVACNTTADELVTPLGSSSSSGGGNSPGEDGILVSIAVALGSTRLIDNLVLPVLP